jgi:hypothetical protein
MLRGHALANWLIHCADPLGPKTRPPRAQLPPSEADKLVADAEAHGVLPAVLRSFPPFSGDRRFTVAREGARARQRTAAAYAMMLRHHADALLAAARGLPATLVKGGTFARILYPEPIMRPYSDIDLLVAPHALPQVAAILAAQDFELAEDGQRSGRHEWKWLHRKNPAILVEVHTNLVHAPSLRAALSLTYADIAENVESPAALLAIAAMHGGLHHFERLRQVVDICQAARHLRRSEDERRLQSLLAGTGARLAAITGLNLAHRFFAEARCREIAQGLGRVRFAGIARVLIDRSVVASTMNEARFYHSWRRQGFRELLKRGKRSAVI